MNEIVCIISCGNTKIWDKKQSPEEVAAKDAYIGGLFKKNKEYAEKFFGNSWFILSDKYGLIDPLFKIENYNISPSQIKNNFSFLNMVRKQQLELNIFPNTIISTCGKIHNNIIKEVFKNSRIVNPLEGLGQGKRMKKLKELIENDKTC